MKPIATVLVLLCAVGCDCNPNVLIGTPATTESSTGGGSAGGGSAGGSCAASGGSAGGGSAGGGSAGGSSAQAVEAAFAMGGGAGAEPRRPTRSTARRGSTAVVRRSSRQDLRASVCAGVHAAPTDRGASAASGGRSPACRGEPNRSTRAWSSSTATVTRSRPVPLLTSDWSTTSARSACPPSTSGCRCSMLPDCLDATTLTPGGANSGCLEFFSSSTLTAAR